MKPKIALFSSFYNESDNISQVVESVAKQSLRPHVWVIADDGSTDNTYSFLQRKAHEYNWIYTIRLSAKKQKDVLTAGRGWRAALKLLTATNETYDYFGKMDGNIILSPDYFERLILFMSQNPKVMVCSGFVFVKQAGKWMLESDSFENKPPNSARGACFLVKRELFTQISVDNFPDTAPDDFFNIKAKMLGYGAAQINVPMYELRPTTKPSPKKLGRAMRYFGANPIYVAGLALALKLNVKESFNLLQGYFAFGGRTVRDSDVRKFYSLAEVFRRTMSNHFLSKRS